MYIYTMSRLYVCVFQYIHEHAMVRHTHTPRTLVQNPEQAVVRLQIQRAATRTPQEELVAPGAVGCGVHEHVVLHEHVGAGAGVLGVPRPEGGGEVEAIGGCRGCV